MLLTVLPLLLGACSYNDYTGYNANPNTSTPPDPFGTIQADNWGAIDDVRKSLIKLFVGLAELLGKAAVALTTWLLEAARSVKFDYPQQYRVCTPSPDDALVSLDSVSRCATVVYDNLKFIPISLIFIPIIYFIIKYSLQGLFRQFSGSFTDFAIKTFGVCLLIFNLDWIVSLVVDLPLKIFLAILDTNSTDLKKLEGLFIIGENLHKGNVAFALLLSVVAIIIALPVAMIGLFFLVRAITLIFWFAISPLAVASLLLDETASFFYQWQGRLLAMSVSVLPAAVLLRVALVLQDNFSKFSDKPFQFLLMMVAVAALFVVGGLICYRLFMAELSRTVGTVQAGFGLVGRTISQGAGLAGSAWRAPGRAADRAGEGLDAAGEALFGSRERGADGSYRRSSGLLGGAGGRANSAASASNRATSTALMGSPGASMDGGAAATERLSREMSGIVSALQSLSNTMSAMQRTGGGGRAGGGMYSGGMYGGGGGPLPASSASTTDTRVSSYGWSSPPAGGGGGSAGAYGWPSPPGMAAGTGTGTGVGGGGAGRGVPPWIAVAPAPDEAGKEAKTSGPNVKPDATTATRGGGGNPTTSSTPVSAPYGGGVASPNAGGNSGLRQNQSQSRSLGSGSGSSSTNNSNQLRSGSLPLLASSVGRAGSGAGTGTGKATGAGVRAGGPTTSAGTLTGAGGGYTTSGNGSDGGSGATTNQNSSQRQPVASSSVAQAQLEGAVGVALPFAGSSWEAAPSGSSDFEEGAGGSAAYAPNGNGNGLIELELVYSPQAGAWVYPGTAGGGNNHPQPVSGSAAGLLTSGQTINPNTGQPYSYVGPTRATNSGGRGVPVAIGSVNNRPISSSASASTNPRPDKTEASGTGASSGGGGGSMGLGLTVQSVAVVPTAGSGSGSGSGSGLAPAPVSVPPASLRAIPAPPARTVRVAGVEGEATLVTPAPTASMPTPLLTPKVVPNTGNSEPLTVTTTTAFPVAVSSQSQTGPHTNTVKARTEVKAAVRRGPESVGGVSSPLPPPPTLPQVGVGVGVGVGLAPGQNSVPVAVSMPPPPTFNRPGPGAGALTALPVPKRPTDDGKVPL